MRAIWLVADSHRADDALSKLVATRRDRKHLGKRVASTKSQPQRQPSVRRTARAGQSEPLRRADRAERRVRSAAPPRARPRVVRCSRRLPALTSGTRKSHGSAPGWNGATKPPDAASTWIPICQPRDAFSAASAWPIGSTGSYWPPSAPAKHCIREGTRALGGQWQLL